MKLGTLLSACAALSLAASTAVAAPTMRPLTAAERGILEHAVRAIFLDPDSAKVQLGPDNPEARDYCGIANGKNRMGGYTGYKPFSVRVIRDRNKRITGTVARPSILETKGEKDVDLFTGIGLDICKEKGFRVTY
jgi:hypothetical protein